MHKTSPVTGPVLKWADWINLASLLLGILAVFLCLTQHQTETYGNQPVKLKPLTLKTVKLKLDPDSALKNVCSFPNPLSCKAKVTTSPDYQTWSG